MDLTGFKAELETRLSIEKEYIIEELSTVNDDEKLDLLGKFNEKYKDLIKRIAIEEGIDLNALDASENSADDLTNEQVIFGKTMSIYDELSDELYEEITSKY
ncbi:MULTISPECIES: hypothetical protein [unclassified Chryseobacterium]|uniref:hypothetical protein n=1 Tax=unclassified Chryseobacterium TaxID=2593645 RepID=UPI000A6F44C4|nr:MULTISPECIES: hypothetical protein [unclassified Chryseobacterium]